MREIPEWQYGLYKDSDEMVYSVLEKLGKSKEFPVLLGGKDKINDFVKLLIISQKMKEYRTFRDIVIKELQKNKVDVVKILEESKELEIPKGTDKSWAVFLQDIRLCELFDEIRDAELEFVGSNDEIVEFTARFLLTQLLQDWRGPLMAVMLKCLEDKKINVNELNNLLKIWDYTKIF